MCVQVDDIKKAIQSLEGKIRTLTPEPMVHTHRNVKMYMLPCTQLCTLELLYTTQPTHMLMLTQTTHTHTLFMLMHEQAASKSLYESVLFFHTGRCSW